MNIHRNVMVVVVGMLAVWVGTAEGAVRFGLEVRPILSDNCFTCHGPNDKKRKAELRFDTKAGAFIDLGGYASIVPGKPDESALYQRLVTDDEDDLMPPVDSGHELSAGEIALVRQWIAEGAEWEEHWAFVPVVRPVVPAVDDLEFGRTVRNPIDQFVLKRLEDAGLTPTGEADRGTLIRRLSLDLTGLAPTLDEVDAFLYDNEEGAYERLVDRLLGSVHYGERMALPWMDAARYADSAGYQNDFKRTQWPWRDWVIKAYNANKPFDEFTIEQLAGDLLTGATEEQRLATAFNRNHRINGEGGIIPEEYLIEYVADRVETTSTVWLGLTMGCVRCHEHKYDPIPHADYYKMFAYFHNIPEKGKASGLAPAPSMRVYTSGSEKAHEGLRGELAKLLAQKKVHAKSQMAAVDTWVKEERASLKKKTKGVVIPNPVAHYTFDEARNNRIEGLVEKREAGLLVGRKNAARIVAKGKQGGAVIVGSGGYVKLDAKISGPFGVPGISVNSPMAWSFWVKPSKDIGNVEGPILAAVTPDARQQGYQINLIATGESNAPYRVAYRLYKDVEDGDGLEVVTVEALVKPDTYHHITVSHGAGISAGDVTITVDGKTAKTKIVRDALSANFFLYEDMLFGALTEKTIDTNIRDQELRNSQLDELMVFRNDLNAEQREALYQLSSLDVVMLQVKHSKPQRGYVESSYYRERDPKYQKLLKDVAAKEVDIRQYEVKHVTQVSIMEEMKQPRKTYLLQRGAYDHPDKSQELEAATLSALPAMAKGLPNSRLGLAKWIMSDENPLTARVAINRYWQMYFGAGLVRTPEDFGAQGAPPTHPELMDWLAAEFRESGWDVKAMQRLIVSSATYRQASVVSEELLASDPENRLLGRGARYRLSGQALRDQALGASGLLVDKVGGPSVMPYQPEGLWDEVSAKGYKYVVAKNDDLYRRSFYTFWRRTVPPPSMMNFDNAGREICTVNVARTNTPLQAMNLLNDPTYVEAARVLAERMMKEGGDYLGLRLNYGYRLVLARQPSAVVRGILLRGYHDYVTTFEADPSAAEALVGYGQSKADGELDTVELAALTMVASVILNLDEAVTKE